MVSESLRRQMTARLASDADAIDRADLDLTAAVEIFLAVGLTQEDIRRTLGWSRSTLYRRLADLREAQERDGAEDLAENLRTAADALTGDEEHVSDGTR